MCPFCVGECIDWPISRDFLKIEFFCLSHEHVYSCACIVATTYIYVYNDGRYQFPVGFLGLTEKKYSMVKRIKSPSGCRPTKT